MRDEGVCGMDADEADVVCGRGGGGELHHGLEHGQVELACGLGGGGGDGLAEAFHAEFLAFAGEGLVDAVGEEQEDVALGEGGGVVLVGSVDWESEGGVRAVGVERGEEGGEGVGGAEVEGGGMAGGGEKEGAGLGVEDEVEGGDKKGVGAALDEGEKALVEAGEEVGGVLAFAGEVLQEGVEDGGHQGGARAMAHDVGDEDARAVVIELEHVEEVATDGARGAVEVMELEAGEGGEAGAGDDGEGVGKEGLLEFAGDFKVAFELGGFACDLRLEGALALEDLLGEALKVLGEQAGFD
jgi:hypothetical protein